MKLFGRRLVVLLVFILLLMAICIVRLGFLQLGHGERYAALLAGRLNSTTTLYAPRGDILDRNGRILATDLACYSLKMDYRALLLAKMEAAGDVDSDAIELGEDKLVDRWVSSEAKRLGIRGEFAARREEILRRVNYTLDMAAVVSGVSREQLDKTANGIILRIRRIRSRVGMTIAEQKQRHTILKNLSETAAVDIRAHSEHAIGMSVGPDKLRWYPYGEIACHVIGRVSRVSRDTLLNDPYKDEPLRKYLPKERVGSNGSEELCEDTLRPVRGWKYEDSLSNTIMVKPALRGNDVNLSIDIELQAEVTSLLAEQHSNGAVVIIDVPTGEILASVSLPQYDLNTFNRDYDDLAKDETNFPLINRVISRKYPPGSTIKPLTALAGLCEGEISLSQTFECRGHYDDRRPRCWSKQGHGSIAVVEAIMNSCNTFFSRTAERVGPDQLAHWYRRFGYGQLPGTGMALEAKGHVPDSHWMEKKFGRDFYVGEVRSMAIGQGTMLATPLQVANATAAIARNGQMLSPSFLKDGNRHKNTENLNLPVDFIAAVREGMRRVVNDPASQTAYSHIESHPADFAGKTGTAQIGGQLEDMAWFTAYAPVDNPQIALAIVLEYAGSGGRNCVPLTEKIVGRCRQKGYLRPSTWHVSDNKGISNNGH